MSAKTPVYHVKKFMDGRMTPSEAHRTLGLRGKPCVGCNRPAKIRIKVFIPLVDLANQNPMLVQAIMETNPDGSMTVPTIDTIYGKMVKMSDVGACEHCQKDAEKAAAKAPSNALVEIDRGPKDTITAQVPRTFARGV